MQGKVIKQRVSAAKGISLVEQYLFEGLTRDTILQKIAKISKSSNRTVDTWISIARPAALERQRAADIERQAAELEIKIQAIKDGLKSDLEIEAFLCQIAVGDLQIEEVISGEAIIRNATPFERIAAIKEIYKKRGSYAPIKTANTDKSGNDVTLPMTDTQVDSIIDEIRKNRL